MKKIKKEYPNNNLEQDVIYARHIYCYINNNSKLVRYVKRVLSKRFRKKNKININNINSEI